MFGGVPYSPHYKGVRFRSRVVLHIDKEARLFWALRLQDARFYCYRSANGHVRYRTLLALPIGKALSV